MDEIEKEIKQVKRKVEYYSILAESRRKNKVQKKREEKLRKLWGAFEELKEQEFNIRMVCDRAGVRQYSLSSVGYERFRSTVKRHPNYTKRKYPKRIERFFNYHNQKERWDAVRNLGKQKVNERS